MRRALTVSGLYLALGLFLPRPAAAQDTRPSPIVEFHTGYAGFIDESWIKRAIIGGAGRVFVSPRVAVGPEFLYLHTSGPEQDWTLTGNISFDLRRETDTSRVTPYLILGAGVLSQTQLVGTGPYTATGKTLFGGGGMA